MSRYMLTALMTLPLLAQAPSPAPAPAPTPAPVPAPAVRPPQGPANRLANIPTAPKAEAIPETQVIGRIGKRIILEKDFLSWLKILAGPRRYEQMFKTPASLTPMRQRYLDSQVLAAKARQQKLQNTADFKELLKIQEDQVLVQLMMNEERQGSEGVRLKTLIENPPEADIKAFFDKNASRFDTPEKFSARHILVGTKGAPRVGDKGLSEDDAKAKIAKIQEELKAGKKFEDLAKEYSDDPSNKNSGGLIKDAAFGGFAKEFEEAVHKQEIGKVGEPVKTVFGYHLILVENRTPKQSAEFEKVKDRVKQQMLPERREAISKQFLESVRKDVDFAAGADAAANLPKADKSTKKPAKKAARK